MKTIKFPISIVLISILNITLHLVFYGKLEHHRDELLYFSLGSHPDFGYWSVPPLISWVAALVKATLGSSLFAVKLVPAVFSGVVSVLGAKICEKLGGGEFAQMLTCLGLLLMPVTLRAFHLFQPVFLDMFFWSLILYFTILYFKEKNSKYLLYLGVATGFAMLNKYLVALLIVSLIISFLVAQRFQIFREKRLYLALGLSLLLFMPNLIWQFVNDFPVISHMRELNARQLVNVERINFLIDQLLMPLIFSIVLIPGLITLLWKKEWRFLGITSVLVVAILLFLRGKSYYTIGLFPMLLASGSIFYEKWVKNSFVRTGLIVMVIVLSFPFLPFGIPIYKQEGMINYFKNLEENYGLLLGRRFEDGTIHSLPQDYADQLGWEELTSIVAEVYESIPDKTKALIYAENYGQAGAIEVIGKKYNLPSPVCFNDSFLFWAPDTFEPDIEYFIYINDEIGENVKEVFENVENRGQISNIHAREYGTTVFLYSNPTSSFNAFWKSVLDSLQE